MRNDCINCNEVSTMHVGELIAMTKEECYRDLLTQAQGLFAGERNYIANAANLTALVFNTLPDLNWVGFYFYDGLELVVGPFQGKPACARIALGRGVCGTAAQTREVQIVQNVHEFPDHIACDAASNSEIVIPLVFQDQLLGVWDVDSPKASCFDVEDQRGMQTLMRLYLQASDFTLC